MPKSTCSIDSCAEDIYARDLCQRHYGRARNAGALPPKQGYRRRPDADAVCEVPGCGKRWYSSGLCRMHYARVRQFGSTDLPTREPDPLCTCKISGCAGTHWGHGWCQKHYGRWRKHGDPLGGQDFWSYDGTGCTVDGCQNLAKTRSRCGKHYKRWREHGGVDVPVPPRINVGKICSVEECRTPARTRGMCESHDRRVQKYGSPYGRFDPTTPDLDLTYHGAHSRVRLHRGSAKMHSCIDGCGRQAIDWSYDHECPRELYSPAGWPFSPDPDHYQPRCRKCHNVFDRQVERRDRGQVVIER